MLGAKEFQEFSFSLITFNFSQIWKGFQDIYTGEVHCLHDWERSK